jgi:hypothetical protein
MKKKELKKYQKLKGKRILNKKNSRLEHTIVQNHKFPPRNLLKNPSTSKSNPPTSKNRTTAQKPSVTNNKRYHTSHKANPG